MTNPQRRRINNRRSEQAKWRRSKEWKELVEVHAHTPDAICVHCLKHHGDLRKNPNRKGDDVYVHLTINHLSRSLYLTKELYTTWNPELMEICCTVCNWMYEKGKVSCPVCHDSYIHVLEPDKMCQKCYDKLHPEQAAIRQANKHQREVRLRKLRNIKRQKDRKFRKLLKTASQKVKPKVR